MSIEPIAAEVERLLRGVDASTAARRGLQLALMCVAVEDFEAEDGRLTDEEIEEARQDLADAIGPSSIDV